MAYFNSFSHGGKYRVQGKTRLRKTTSKLTLQGCLHVGQAALTFVGLALCLVIHRNQE